MAAQDEVIPVKYDWIGEFSEEYDLAMVKLDNKFGYINMSGKEVIPVIYDWIGEFSIVNG
ncbi:MAG: WG repeat-containing protein, partial [Prevotellaceae bacterium]|nr:WG repeat-containing protein [Prevotellaceae bacterium]